LSKLSVVWVYYGLPQASNEIEVSIKLAKHFLVDAKNYLVCGDAVPWAEHIASPLPPKGVFGKWFDSAIKLLNIINDPRVSDDFLWLYDDTFVLDSLNVQELITPRYSGLLLKSTPVSTWGGVKNETVKVLPPNSKNFSSHYPMVYNKKQLEALITQYQITTRPRLIESIYGNLCGLEPELLPQWFNYVRTPLPHNFPTPGRLVNVGHYNKHAKDVMMLRYGNIIE
jgi:hypothetical protein